MQVNFGDFTIHKKRSIETRNLNSVIRAESFKLRTLGPGYFLEKQFVRPYFRP